MNLFEIMQKAGRGKGLSALAAQFGLSEEQVSQALAAMLPAFSLGLKRNTADPLGLAEFLQRLAAGDYLSAYQNPDWARGGGAKAGEDALAFLFGSPEAAAALARQAAAMSGLAPEKLAELLPALASMLLGGLAAQSAAANPLLKELFKQPGAQPKRTAGRGPLDRYEDEQAEKDRADAADLVRKQAEMVQSGMAALQAGAAAWQTALGQAAPAGPSGASAAFDAPATGADLFGEMFEPGRRVADSYREQMEAAFERLRRDDPGG